MKKTFLRHSLFGAGMSTALFLGALTMPTAVFAEDTAPAASLEDLDSIDIDTLWKNADAAGYVALGDLDLLEVTQYRYVVSEEDISNDLESRMYEYGETSDAETAEYGDVVTMDLSYVVDGEEYTEADYLIDVGYEELGTDFDEILEGCSVGDELTLTHTFTDEYVPFEEWEDATVDISAVVTAIERTEYPELNDAWVAENTDYETVAEYSSHVGEELQAYYDEESANELLQDVIAAAMEECEFDGYPEDLYTTAYENILGQYQEIADMWGMELEDLYDAYGMDEDSVADTAEEYVHYQLFLSAYGAANEVTVTADDIRTYLDTNAENYNYASAEEMLADYPLSDIAMAVAEEKISTALLENANVTIEEYNTGDDETLSEFDEDESEYGEWTDWDDENLITFDEIDDDEDDAWEDESEE